MLWDSTTGLGVAGIAAALIAGATGSGHCVLMCGPLACASVGAAGRLRRRAAIAWHAGRLGAYALLGGLLGATGRGLLAGLAGSVQPVLPWVMVAGLALMAFEGTLRLPAVPGLTRVLREAHRAGEGFSLSARAALRGAATPLLPCGLLYGAFLTALGTGSALLGALLMLAFGLGAVPVLALAQIQLGAWVARPGASLWLRRLAPLGAAAIVAWRALSAHAGVPSCH